MREFKKICERSNDEGLLPRRQCQAQCPLRKTVPPVFPVQNSPWKRGGLSLDSERGETRSGSSAAFSRPRNFGVHWRVLSGDPSLNYTVMSSGDLAFVLFRRRSKSRHYVYRHGSDGLLNSENPHTVWGVLISPCPTRQSPHWLPWPLEISQGSLQAPGGGRDSGHSAPGQGHQARQLLPSLTFRRELFLPSSFWIRPQENS